MELLRRIAAGICQRRMAAPALLALESLRPLGFIGSQALVALRPFLETAVQPSDIQRLVAILERRSGIEELMKIIEEKLQNSDNE